MTFNPYLFFGNRRCREAFTAYHEIFGGDLHILTNGDMPEGERMDGADEDVVMHAALMIGGGLLMGSDDPTADGTGSVQGMQVSYAAADVVDANRVFQALSDGGQVTLPISETSWSPAFGMCIDRFGTPWMVGAQPAEQS